MGLGRILIIVGAVLVIAGILLTNSQSFSHFTLGRLPGDLRIKKENFSFYFPLTTCCIVSLLLTLIIYIIRKIG